MSHIALTSAQVKTLLELDQGHGVLLHDSDVAVNQVDVYLNDSGRFIPQAVSHNGEVLPLRVLS